jgi:hypothetical protein
MKAIIALVFVSAGFVAFAGTNGGNAIADAAEARDQQLQEAMNF